MRLKSTQNRPQQQPDPLAPVLLSVAFPYAAVGPSAVGGAEVILSEIEASLPALGFRSVVVAHADSRPHGRLYPTRIPAGEITDALRSQVEAAQQANITRALAENAVALVHMHGLDFHRYTLPDNIPVVVTLHLPPAWYPDSIWSLPPNYHFVCVSETERQACPATAQDRITVIQNGVRMPAQETLRPEGHYALMLSRICPEKNLHAGLDAARRAHMPVILAGEVFPYETHQRYFAEEIQPRLSPCSPGHESRARESFDAGARFMGPATGPAKTRLLARAACLLVPSLAPETSCLAAMEALAAGIPVIAVASGAVPEIVEDGRTGFLVPACGDITAAMADAISRIAEISRQTCRATAEERFRLDTMLSAYCDLYRRRALVRPAGQCAFTEPEHAAFSTPHSISFEQVTRSEQLEALRGDWAALWQRDPHATPFQHPAWLLPWWHQFGPDGHLDSVAARGDGGQLVALLPLYHYANSGTGQRQLLFVGAATSDYQGGVFDPNIAPQLALSCLSKALQEPSWDTLTLMQLRGDSALLHAQHHLASQINLHTAEADPCWTIDLAQRLPAKLRANARRYRHRADALGSLQCTLATTPEEALASFEDLARLHRQRWELRGEPGLLADERVPAHHREAIPQLLQAGLLRLFRLSLNDNPLGVLYALADAPDRPHRTLFLYLIGIDPDAADLSPGTLLIYAVWEYACAEGFARIDFLRGGEAYKQLWGAQPQPTFALHAAANTARQKQSPITEAEPVT